MDSLPADRQRQSEDFGVSPMIAYLRQRWADFIHEGAIRAVQDEIVWIERNFACTPYDYQEYGQIAILDRELASLIAKRSPSQLKRMGVE